MTARVRTAVICGLVGLCACRLDLENGGGSTSNTSPREPREQREDDVSVGGAAGGGSVRTGSATRDSGDKGADCPASFAGARVAEPPMAANGVTTFRGYV